MGNFGPGMPKRSCRHTIRQDLQVLVLLVDQIAEAKDRKDRDRLVKRFKHTIEHIEDTLETCTPEPLPRPEPVD